MSAAASAAQLASRVDIERTLYRPEVFQYQRSLAFGEPVDERSLSALWCALPAALLLVVCWLFASATYHPRARGTASRGSGPDIVVLSLAATGGALADARSGDEATVRIAGGAPRRMIVRRSGVGPCAASPRCVEIEGRIEGPPDALDALALPADASVPAEVVLPARSVVR